MVTSSMADSTNSEELAESVQELRFRLEAMKRMMDLDGDDEETGTGRKRKAKAKNSIIDASFLSFVFILVLVLILGVSLHSFHNLYHAVVKKFYTRQHTEL